MMMNIKAGMVLVAGLSGWAFAQGFVSAPVPLPKPTVTKAVPLREGFVINGCDGMIKSVPDQDRWLFIPDTAITDGRATHAAEQAIELLPCGTLEKMTSTTEPGRSISLRLWARVLVYKKEILLYPIYFIPTSSSPEPPDPQSTQDNSSRAVPIPAEPNEPSIIPENIRSLLKPRQVVNLTRIRTMLDVESDAILANRAGFVTLDPQSVFQPDVFGRKIDEVSFQLLRCSVLEATEKQLKAAGPARQRYKIAGIITRYKGKYYLLLQRATRTYTHGNFTQ
jgi:hypothetical protein